MYSQPIHKVLGFNRLGLTAAKSFQNLATGLSAAQGPFPPSLIWKSNFPTQWAQLTSSRYATLLGLVVLHTASPRPSRVHFGIGVVSQPLLLRRRRPVSPWHAWWTNAPDIGSPKVVCATDLAERFHRLGGRPYCQWGGWLGHHASFLWLDFYLADVYILPTHVDLVVEFGMIGCRGGSLGRTSGVSQESWCLPDALYIQSK